MSASKTATNFEPVLKATKTTQTRCSKALQLLDTNPKSTTDVLPELVTGLVESFGQILKSLRHAITGLSLAYKPPITIDAAVSQLQKVGEELDRLISCVIIASGGQAWDLSCLVKEWRGAIQKIGGETVKYIKVLGEVTILEQRGERDDGPEGSNPPYLAHTGMVWDSIDIAGGYSRTENQAVIKEWNSQKALLKDAWTEFVDYLEDQREAAKQEEEEDDDTEEDSFGDDDDDWGELEKAMNGGKMSAEELATAEATKPLIALYQILHASTPRFLPSLITTPETTYQSILQPATAMTSSFDVVVGAMYPQQDQREINQSMTALHKDSMTLVNTLRDRQSTDATLRSFLDKWEARAIKEKETWESRRLSLSSLDSALS